MPALTQRPTLQPAVPRSGPGGTHERPNPPDTLRARLQLVVQGVERSVAQGVCRGASLSASSRSPLALLERQGLHDVSAVHAGHVGLALALTAADALVWVQDGLSERETGRVHALGLVRSGLEAKRLVLVRTSRPRDALWAMEEAVKGGARTVIGEVWGAPPILDFTATRRLDLFAREAGVRCLLARLGPQGGRERVSSGAVLRWRVAPLASAADPHDARAPGAPRFRLDLLRARDRAPGSWIVERAPAGPDAEGGAADRLCVVSALADGELAPSNGEGRDAGERHGAVVPFKRERGEDGHRIAS